MADFYQRRIYNLQHKKYKMLTRWAHFALTSNSIDRIGQSGTFTYGRLEYEIENSVKRFERLSQNDGYSEIRDGLRKRPQTADINDNSFIGTETQKAQMTEDKLQEDDRSADPISCIRMDDFEVYLRIQSYHNVIQRPLKKFIARAKWISTAKSMDIMSEFHVSYK